MHMDADIGTAHGTADDIHGGLIAGGAGGGDFQHIIVRTPVAPPFHVPTDDQRGMVIADMGIELDLGPRRRGIEPHQMTVTDQRLAVEVMIGPGRAQLQESIVRFGSRRTGPQRPSVPILKLASELSPSRSPVSASTSQICSSVPAAPLLAGK